MALIKDFETESGVTGKFWKVISTNPIDNDGMGGFNIALYLSETDFTNGKKPLLVRSYSFPYIITDENGNTVETFNSPFTIANLDIKNSFDLAQEWLKTNIAFFTDATET